MAYANFAKALALFSAGVNFRFFALVFFGAAAADDGAPDDEEAPASSSESLSLSNEMKAEGALTFKSCMLMMDNEREIGM